MSLADVTRPDEGSPQAGAASLEVIAALFEQLRAERIPYCHWKGNEHLHSALAGDSDLDVLVARGAAVALARVLGKVGFRRFIAVPDNSYPGVEDYLGFDARTGKLVHLHLHYQLVLTRGPLFGYRLPWEDTVLSTRRLAAGVVPPVYIADPHVELVVLAVRAALQHGIGERIRSAARSRPIAVRAEAEFRWLAERVDPATLYETSRSLVGARAARLLVAISAAGAPTLRDLVQFRRSIDPRIGELRTFGAMEAMRHRWWRRWRGRWAGLRNEYLKGRVPVKRTLPHGGAIIAVVGADGSGKSTVAREITQWLSWKIDVVSIYLGSGDGPKSVRRRVFEALQSLVLRSIRGRDGGTAIDTAGVAKSRARPAAILRSLRRAWWALRLADEKRARLETARRARNLGMVVVCDRLPQRRVPGINDGPLLADWLESGIALRRAAARREQQTFRALERCRPDLVVKLHVSPDVAWRRKPETPKDLLERKVDVVKKLSYPPTVRVVDIDADQPMADVLLQVKQATWECL